MQDLASCSSIASSYCGLVAAHCHPKASPWGCASWQNWWRGRPCILAFCKGESAEVPPGESELGEGRRPPFPSGSVCLTTHRSAWSGSHHLPGGSGWCRQTGTLHSACGESSSCLLTSLCPKGCLASQGERKWDISSQGLMKVEPLPPFGHQAMNIALWLSQTLEISAVTIALSIPQFHSHKNSSHPIQQFALTFCKTLL